MHIKLNVAYWHTPTQGLPEPCMEACSTLEEGNYFHADFDMTSIHILDTCVCSEETTMIPPPPSQPDIGQQSAITGYMHSFWRIEWLERGGRWGVPGLSQYLQQIYLLSVVYKCSTWWHSKVGYLYLLPCICTVEATILTVLMWLTSKYCKWTLHSNILSKSR